MEGLQFARQPQKHLPKYYPAEGIASIGLAQKTCVAKSTMKKL